MESASQGNKNLIISKGIISTLIILVVFISLTQANEIKTFLTDLNPFKSKPQVKLIREVSLTDYLGQNKARVLSMDFEYDFTKNTLRKLFFTVIKDDPSSLLVDRPAQDAEIVLLKVLITSKQGKELQSGWLTLSKKIYLEREGVLKFRLKTFYENQANIKISLPNNKVIWEEIMTQ